MAVISIILIKEIIMLYSSSMRSWVLSKVLMHAAGNFAG